MEVLHSRDQHCLFITQHPLEGNSALYIDLSNGNMELGNLCRPEREKLQCVGLIYGVIGRFVDPKAVLVITEQAHECDLPAPISKPIFSVNQVSIIRITRGPPMGAPLEDLGLAQSPEHPRVTAPRPTERLPQLVEHTLALFNESTGRDAHKHFYFIPDGDICSTYQRFCQLNKSSNVPNGDSSSESTDEENRISAEATNDFFWWNKVMLEALPRGSYTPEGIFGKRLIHGFCTYRNITITSEDVNFNGPQYTQPSYQFDFQRRVSIFLISRRSRHRAGRRYKRRGVDHKGHVANFVETENIVFSVDTNHLCSFVQIRGSIPLYWKQQVVGLKYQPITELVHSQQDNLAAFKLHFENLKRMYGGKVAIVNLVGEQRKESQLWGEFAKYILELNSPDIFYICYDYHAQAEKESEAWKREQLFLWMTRLVQENSIKFSWMDHEAPIITQCGVWRVNCVDCLDRTNIVQRWLAERTARSLLTTCGCLLPEDGMPLVLRQAMKEMWADNGDVISRQYAGTDALKGEVTRTGQRQVTGLFKDGINSIDRRYFIATSDSIRQWTIDILTQGSSDEFSSNPNLELVEVAKKSILAGDAFFKGWLVTHVEEQLAAQVNGSSSTALVPGSPFKKLNFSEKPDPNIQVFIICRDHFYLVYLSPDRRKPSKYIRVPMDELQEIYVGKCPLPGCEASSNSKSDQDYQREDLEKDMCHIQILYSMNSNQGLVNYKMTLRPVLDLENCEDIPDPNDKDSYPYGTEFEPLSQQIIFNINEEFGKALSRKSLRCSITNQGKLSVQVGEYSATNQSTLMGIGRKVGAPVSKMASGAKTLIANFGPKTNIRNAHSSEDVQSESGGSNSDSSSRSGGMGLISSDRFVKFLNRKAAEQNQAKNGGLQVPPSGSGQSSNDSLFVTPRSASPVTLDKRQSLSSVDLTDCGGPVNSESGASEATRAATSGLTRGATSKLHLTPSAPSLRLGANNHDLIKRLQSQSCRTQVMFI